MASWLCLESTDLLLGLTSLCPGHIVSKVLTGPPPRPSSCLFPSITFAESCLQWPPSLPQVLPSPFPLLHFLQSSRRVWKSQLSLGIHGGLVPGPSTDDQVPYCRPSASTGRVSTGSAFTATEGRLDLVRVFPCSQSVFPEAQV